MQILGKIAHRENGFPPPQVDLLERPSPVNPFTRILLSRDKLGRPTAMLGSDSRGCGEDRMRTHRSILTSLLLALGTMTTAVDGKSARRFR